MAKEGRIKEFYDAHYRGKGKPPADSVLRKAEEAIRTRSKSELEDLTDYSNVPDIMTPINKLKGHKGDLIGPRSTKKYFH